MSRIIKSLSHGEEFKSTALGAVHVMNPASALTNGFSYSVPVSSIAAPGSLMLLSEHVYFVLEPLNGGRLCLLTPWRLIGRLLGHDSSIEEKALPEMALLRLLTGEMGRLHPQGLCYRARLSSRIQEQSREQQTLCLFSLLSSRADIQTLDKKLIEILDFGIMIWDQAFGHAVKQTQPCGLEKQVKSHQF